MMRIVYGIFTLLMLAGCSKQPKASENQLSTNDTVQNIELVESTTNQIDTLSYIGYVQKFDDNDSFYTDLYFVKGFNYDLYDEITNMGEKVIYQDGEYRRTRMSIEKVGKYFNLNGLKEINIYNKENIKLTSGRLSHIEYVDDIIESRFVAVFQVDNPDISEPLFCIGNPKNELSRIDFTSFEDNNLKKELIEYLKLNTNLIYDVSHYRIDNKTIYSTVSADTTAYIIETTDKSQRTLYRSNFSEAINGLAIISKEINGKQVLLTDCGMPDTDMTWTSLLIFNGTEYKINKDHRINER